MTSGTTYEPSGRKVLGYCRTKHTDTEAEASTINSLELAASSTSPLAHVC